MNPKIGCYIVMGNNHKWGRGKDLVTAKYIAEIKRGTKYVLYAMEDPDACIQDDMITYKPGTQKTLLGTFVASSQASDTDPKLSTTKEE